MNLRRRSRGKFHKLPHLTRDVTGQHYRPVLSDAYARDKQEEEAAEIQAKESAIAAADVHCGGVCD